MGFKILCDSSQSRDVGMMAEFVLGQATNCLENCTWNGCKAIQEHTSKVYSYVCGRGLGMSLADCSGRTVIRSTLIWWYACYYIRDNFMYVGVAWVRPWLIALEGEYIRSTLSSGMLLCKGRFYVLYIRLTLIV